jgi:hypothetical protein
MDISDKNTIKSNVRDFHLPSSFTDLSVIFLHYISILAIFAQTWTTLILMRHSINIMVLFRQNLIFCKEIMNIKNILRLLP